MNRARQSSDIAARIGAGAISGAAATVVMDAVTEVFYTKHIEAMEARVSQRGAAQATAHKLMQALKLKPNEEDSSKAGRVLHWAMGIGSGMIAGALADGMSNRTVLAVAATTGGMLAVDEIGLSALGGVPPSTKYPWQTNLRSFVGHVSYGIALAAGYAFLRSLSHRAR